MIGLRRIAAMLVVLSVQFSAHARPITEQLPVDVTGPEWVPDTQAVITCMRDDKKMKCATTSLSKKLGDIRGILQLKPLRNATASWIAFTNKTLVVCGVKVSTKQSACFEVEGFEKGLPVPYPKNTIDLTQLIERFVPSTSAFAAAGRQVSNTLGTQIKDEKGDPIYALSTENEPPCSEDCTDEDMPPVIIVGTGGGGSGGSGSGGGGPTNPNIDPNTGLPYPQVYIYPAPPVWPKGVSWCSLTGFLCKIYQMPAPSPEWCYDRLQDCYRQATDLYTNNREALPGSGPDYPSRWRAFVRDCMARTGCPPDY